MTPTSYNPPSSSILRLTCLFLLIFSGLNGVHAQDSEKIKLQWETNKKDADISPVSLRFTGSHALSDYPDIPFYLHRLSGLASEVLLTDAEYRLMDGDEISACPFLTSSPPVIQLFSATERKQPVTLVYVYPFRFNSATGSYEKLTGFRLQPRLGPPAGGNQNVFRGATFTSNSVLQNGDWYKLGVTEDGVYRISYDMLNELGLVSSPLPVSSIRLYGNGGGILPVLNSAARADDLNECAIAINDRDQDGLFEEEDYLLFYGQGPHRWKYSNTEERYVHEKNPYSDTTFYFITKNTAGIPKRILRQANISPLPGDPLVNTFTDYAFHEEDLRNFIKSGRNWYGEVFDVTLRQSFSFSFPNMIAGTAKIKSAVAARTSTSFLSTSRFIVANNNNTVLTHSVSNVGTSYTDDFARTSTLSGQFNVNAGQDLVIDYTFQPYNASSSGWLDYVALNVTRTLSFSGNELVFRDRDTTGTGSRRTYSVGNAISGSTLWVVTSHNDVKEQEYLISNGTLEFTHQPAPGGNAEFILFNTGAARTPAISGKVENQNLHGLSAMDYIIITAPEFQSEAERLATFHRSEDNLRSAVVTTTQVYNEFSGGAQDVAALRDFIRMFYERAGGVAADFPKYVLLFGDGSYDLKDRISNNTNFIPTFQSLNAVSLLQSYTSDDFYGMLDPAEGQLNGPELMDVGIGRMPVKTTEEAKQMVDKVITYSTAGTVTDQGGCNGRGDTRLGDWRNVICFVADDQDRNLHFRQSERIANQASGLAPAYNIDKIVSDAYQQFSTPGGQRYPDVNEAITRRVEKGALLINYTGHGGELGWAAESILNNDMINGWRNLNNMPAFITATCEFSRYDDPQRTSAGEFVLLNEQGGGICLFTTVRLAFAIDNELINSDMMTHMFSPLNGEMPRTGDIIRLAKRDNPSNRNLTLLGDPALRLAYPKHKVVTTSIAETGGSMATDTLRALSRITISGKITDQSGQTISGFNGIVYPTVYDKNSKVTTLANDQSGGDISLPDSFLLRKNILYKGKASVVNGEFTCSFIVPRDIALQYGKGRLSYYAQNGSEDAQGYNESIIIGGISGNSLQDEKGPEIRLYLNDENFIQGSLTNSSPSIYAVLFDSSGINTVGNGIGHDLVAQLDGSPRSLYVLNDYYEAELNSYQKGRVVYPLQNLSEGLHTLTLKAWDINNNSAEAATEFVVSSSAELALQKVLNYPNPFTTRTQFMFEHNKPCTGMAIQVQIFTVSGKLVKTIDAYQVCEGFRNIPVEWDGRDDYGERLGRGVYIYRLRIRTAEGESAQKTERLVLLR